MISIKKDSIISYNTDMNPADYLISVVTWQQHEIALRTIREQVFIREQAVPEALEWDGMDENAIHILVRHSSGQAIATARLLNDGHIGRMAVLPDYRQQGVGSAMLRALLKVCQQHQLQAYLDAQTHALGFYQKMGFKTQGSEFMDAGIPHYRMILGE